MPDRSPSRECIIASLQQKDLGSPRYTKASDLPPRSHFRRKRALDAIGKAKAGQYQVCERELVERRCGGIDYPESETGFLIIVSEDDTIFEGESLVERAKQILTLPDDDCSTLSCFVMEDDNSCDARSSI